MGYYYRNQMHERHDELYEKIKAHGYHIDVRGANPSLLLGNQVWMFETWINALYFADSRISNPSGGDDSA
jgi:hypothetical protein